MLALVALTLTFVQAPLARDFLPLIPGTKWTYQETGEDNLTYIHEVQASKTIGGKEATPVVIRYKGNPLSTTYYLADENSVGIVAEDDERMIYSPPRPLFKLGTEAQQWTYSGQVPFNSGVASITLTGSSHLGAKRKILGNEVDTLEVTIDATLNPPATPKSKPKPMTMHQVAIYGKGIGLVEMTMSATTNGETHQQHLELTKVQFGRSG